MYITIYMINVYHYTYILVIIYTLIYFNHNTVIWRREKGSHLRGKKKPKLSISLIYCDTQYHIFMGSFKGLSTWSWRQRWINWQQLNYVLFG